MTERERFDAAMAQLCAEGAPEQAEAFRALVKAGLLSMGNALEAIAFAEAVADEEREWPIPETKYDAELEAMVARHHREGQRN